MRTDEEALIGWVRTAAVIWVLLAVPAAVLLGRAIDASNARGGRPDLDVHDVTCSGTHPQG